MAKNQLDQDQSSALLETLRQRFENHLNRHAHISWAELEKKLLLSPAKLWSLAQMEATGGEPDVVGIDQKTEEYLFFDCAPESPKGRRSLCYDRRAWEARKEFKPVSTAVDRATEMGIELLDEVQYQFLQTLGEFDTKTSSWLLTPSEIRKHGGAIFGDCRYHHVFIYHNGADSYYAARGFRGCLKV